MSYGADTPCIDFSRHALICLSGKNGHGKSALLDAMTWAIWGQSRKTSSTVKPDKGLLRLGQTDMMVTFDFKCKNQTYRVRREFAITYGKPHVALEFGLIDKQGNVTVLSDKTIRTTQKKIENTLCLDFETFCNSAFLRQGQSNEFSQKSPKERKEILASILGLYQYEKTKKLALEKARNAEQEKRTFIKLQEQIEQELTKELTVNEEKIKLEQQLKNVAKNELTHKKELNRLSLNQNKLFEKQKKLELKLFEKKQLTSEEQNTTQQLIELTKQWKNVHHTYLNLPNKTKLEIEKSLLLEQLKKQQEVLQKQLDLRGQLFSHKEKKLKIEKEIDSKFLSNLEKQRFSLEQQKSKQISHEKILQTLKQHEEELNKEITTAKNDLTKTEAFLISEKNTKMLLQKEQNQFEKRKEHYQKFIARGNFLKKELLELEQKKDSYLCPENPNCPLCEQNLSSSRKRFLQKKINKQKTFKHHRINRLASLIKKLKTILLEQHTKIDGSTQKIEKLNVEQHKKDDLTKRVFQFEEKQKSINKQKNDTLWDIKSIQIDLKKLEQETLALQKQYKATKEENSEYKICSQKCMAVEMEIQKTIHDKKQQQKIEHELKKIEQQLLAHIKHGEHKETQTQRRLLISKNIANIKNIRQKLLILGKELFEHESLNHEKQQVQEQQDKITIEAKILNQEKEQLLQLSGQLANRLEKIKTLKVEHKNLELRNKSLTKEKHEYQEIATAMSKDGIQAILIEDILPELEQETNTLLSKLTDNQSHVIIESLRDLQKGGTKETLDIKISDSLGIRPYEMFSGGEAFRIDFALRVALSKLLARRAGTSLQTLIIDEGFGSQDEDGLSKIMDAIYIIQEDFCKVIIVSHLTTMKDQFPVHFVVEKTPNGSQISIFEQG